MSKLQITPFLPPIILVIILATTFYQTVTSPNEDQKSKLLETLQSNILHYMIPVLLFIQISTKQIQRIPALTIIILSIMSAYKRFKGGFRFATILIYAGYSLNNVVTSPTKTPTYWFDILLPILLLLITKMKYDRGEKVM